MLKIAPHFRLGGGTRCMELCVYVLLAGVPLLLAHDGPFRAANKSCKGEEAMAAAKEAGMQGSSSQAGR